MFWNFYGNFDGFLNFGGFLDFDDSLSEFGQLFNFIHFAHHMSRLLHCYVTVEQQWEDISNEISLMSCCDVFFRHSEPSSIDFFGYFGTIVFKLVLLSFYCFILKVKAFLGF